MEHKIKSLLKEKKCIVIAIDGMSGAGKTTYANQLALKLNANLIHMDDFFLPTNLKTEKRLQMPGGNIHYERFQTEIIDHLNEDIHYQRWDCDEKKFTPSISLKKKNVLIIEGVYALHPSFGKYYDLSIFMKIDDNTQIKRISSRNPSKAKQFFSEWIPLENKYFKEFEIEKNCDFIIDTP